MTNFKEKINESEKVIDNFFNTELEKIEISSRELNNLIEVLTNKVKKLVNLYKIKFKEQFKSAKDEYEHFGDGVNELNFLITQLKNTEYSTKNKIKELKDFKIKKKILESELNRFIGFYEFNKSALISEFSIIKDFYNFLEKNKVYLNKHIEDYNTKITANVVEKINNVLAFDELKILYSSRNYLPKNISKIYQPIDRTNIITIYDAENEVFIKKYISPAKLSGFTFLPFSRYINFAGKLIVCGGYGDKGTNKSVWVLEHRDNSKKDQNQNKTKKNNISSISADFYSNVNKNFIYEDDNSDFKLVRASDMIYPRAGHSMVSLFPNLIFVLSGTEGNKTCELFQLDLNRWEEVASLNNHRIDPSACIFKNYIYVFFGLLYHRQTKKYSFLDSIERISIINIQKKEWEFVSPKLENNLIENIPRSLGGIIIKNDSSSIIYICGGQVEKDKYSNDILEVNLDSNTITFCEKKLPKASAFIEQNFLYLFKTGINFDIYGDMFYYNSVNDSFNFIFQKTRDSKSI